MIGIRGDEMNRTSRPVNGRTARYAASVPSRRAQVVQPDSLVVCARQQLVSAPGHPRERVNRLGSAVLLYMPDGIAITCPALCDSVESRLLQSFRRAHPCGVALGVGGHVGDGICDVPDQKGVVGPMSFVSGRKEERVVMREGESRYRTRVLDGEKCRVVGLSPACRMGERRWRERQDVCSAR